MLVSKPGKKDACNIKFGSAWSDFQPVLHCRVPHRIAKDSIALLVVSGCSQVFTMLTNGMEYF